MTFQRAEKIIDRYAGNKRIIDGIHVTGCHGTCSDQTEKTAVLMNDRKSRNTAVLLSLKDLPGM